ncbi:TPA: hypothetical protein I7C77_003459 [Vibrio cholerae]|nr:hypothetical protein [Vibrio cholerae]
MLIREKLLKCYFFLGFWFLSASVYADQKFVMKINGADAKIENNDVISFLLLLGKAAAALCFGGACIYGLWHVGTGVWHKWGDWMAGRAELKELLAPAALGVFFLVMTFGIAYYAVTNFSNIMG